MVALITLAIALGVVTALTIQTWRTMADSERALARTDRKLAETWSVLARTERTLHGDNAERAREFEWAITCHDTRAANHDRRAARFERLARFGVRKGRS